MPLGEHALHERPIEALLRRTGGVLLRGRLADLGLRVPAAILLVETKALQERFKSRSAARTESPEATIARWYSIAAPADAAQAGRMTAVIRALLPQERETRTRK